MRLTRDRLVFLCLAALHDMIDRAAMGPADGPQLRAVLAMLFALGDRRDTGMVFDAFWKASRLKPDYALTEYRADQQRVYELQKLWPQICRHVGVEANDALSARLLRACRHGETERQGLLRAMRRVEHERATFKRHRRQKQQCTITG
jgi:hypothetical protein